MEKEKAKAYDKALERAKKWLNAPNVDKIPTYVNRVIEEIFPELKESEDERIKNEIIKFLELPHPQFVGKRHQEKWIDWLEKQNEKINPYSGTSFKYNGHTWGMCARDNGIEILFDNELKAFVSSEKSFVYPIHPQPYLASKSVVETIKEEKVDNANKAKPKFHEGDWIVTPENKVLQITSIEGTSYRFNNEFHYWEICYCDEQCRLWTIQDAKDGDVLFHSDSASNGIFIFKEILDRGFAKEIICYCDYDSEDHFCLSEHHTCCWADAKILHPATLEQRDLLFQKMREAGYEWNSEKLELKKINQEYTPKHKVGDTIYYNSFGEVKSMIVANVVTDSTDNPMYEDENGNAVFEEDLIEQKSAWSEEDENRINHLIAYFEDKELFTAEDDIVYANRLKSLKDRIGG